MGCDGDVLVRYDNNIMIVCVRLKIDWYNTVSFFFSGRVGK